MAKPHKHFTGPKVLKVEQLSGLDDAIRGFYNTFMQAVEPDLLTTALDSLEAKYATETPEQRTQRAHRYNHAYNLFMTAYTHAVQQWQADIEFYRKQAATQAAKQQEATDRAAADDIADSLANA